MNFREMEQIIFKSSTNIMKKIGKEAFKSGLISKVVGRKIDDIYHIYGDVSGYENYDQIKTHIKINLKHKRLEGVSCGCAEFREISKHKSLFMCEHLTGTAYKFLDLLREKNYKERKTLERFNKEKDLSTGTLSEDTSEKSYISKKSLEEKNKKTTLSMNIKITYKSWNNLNGYIVEFRLGCEQKYLIEDLRNFIRELDRGKSIYFNNQFTYNPREHTISHKDIEVINFIREYAYKDNTKAFFTNNLIIPSNDLRRFLQYIEGDKIQFNYNGMEFNPSILKRDLPIKFTLKEENQYLKLTTYRKLPISLSENNDAYFFNDNIYIPSQNQIKKYISLYNKFKAKDEILYDKTPENYNKIISLITSISEDITVSEEVKAFASKLLKFNFFMYKEEGNIYCDVYGTYNNEKVNIIEKSNSQVEAIRDFRGEEKILMKLEYYNFIKRNHRLMFIGEDEGIFNIIKKSGLDSLGTLVLGKGLENIKLFNSNFIHIDFYEEDGYLKFNYNMEDMDVKELGGVFKSYKSNKRFYKTKDNKFIDFEDEEIVNFLDLIGTLDGEENIKDGSLCIEKNKALYMAERLKNRDYNFGKGIDLIKEIENKITKLNTKDIILPKNLNAKLRGYQIVGFKWFKNLSELEFGGILADEMGLGKTVQTIAFLLSEKGKKSLVVAPTSLIYNWKDEIEKFAPDLKIGIAHGNNEKQEAIINEFKQYDVILTTYGTLRNNINRYNNVQFDYCIIDEAQNIKNPEAQVTLAVKEIKAKVRFALTGTPIENNLVELWSIFDFIMPGYLYSKENFEEKFVYSEGYYLENLKLMIKPFILRRTKKEVIYDLPDKIEKKILVEMTNAQKSVYKAYIKKAKERMKVSSKGKIEIFSYLTKLRQICLDPSLVFDEYQGGSGKLKVAMTLIEENTASQGKTLLFSQFTSALKNIAEVLKQNGIKYFYLDGSTPSKERIKIVNEFNEGNEAQVFLISLKAGGTGLNLTSSNLVIHFDPWWNPAVEDQATDRAHRIGQKNVVEVVRLVSKGTIEEKIISLQEHKKELIESIITGELKDSSTLNKLSKEELMELFYR